MYEFTRMKRVTDPLDDKVKARIIGKDRTVPDYVSSGSEHGSHAGDDDFFFDFGVDDDDGDFSPPMMDCESVSDSDCDSLMCDSSGVSVDLIKHVLQNQMTDEFQKMLKSHVLKAVEIFACLSSDREMMRRNVMSFLRNYGYNAAICKTKWKSSGGLTAGNYEFIDVIRSEHSTRYFVDLDFASEFEIARPTNSYERLFQHLPRVFVGKSEDLKQILKAISDGAKRSLKARGLILPPWRKHRFMQNKWLSSFRRTTNLFPATFSSSQTTVKTGNGVQCRAVGFDAGVNGGRLLTARTR